MGGGDLEEDGWAVYNGVDITNVDKFITLRQDVMDQVHYLPNKWNNVQSDYSAQHCGRMQRKLGEHQLAENACEKEMESISRFYNTILNDKVKKIKGFEECSFPGMSLLYNKNEIQEQKPHKDYEVSTLK